MTQIVWNDLHQPKPPYCTDVAALWQAIVDCCLAQPWISIRKSRPFAIYISQGTLSDTVIQWSEPPHH